MIDFDLIPEPELRKLYDLMLEMQRIDHRILVVGEDSDYIWNERKKFSKKFVQQVNKCDRISNRKYED